MRRRRAIQRLEIACGLGDSFRPVIWRRLLGLLVRSGNSRRGPQHPSPRITGPSDPPPGWLSWRD